MTTTQVVKRSVTNNTLSEDYPHLDDHTRQTTGFELIDTKVESINLSKKSNTHSPTPVNQYKSI